MNLRAIRLWRQRRKRGWDDSDTWSLDCTIAEFVLPRLVRFKEITCGHPGDSTPDEWNVILDKMIAAMKFSAGEDRWSASEAEYEQHREGIELFGKYFWHLWW